MSGIGAIFHRDGAPASEHTAREMARTLAMYGPAREGIITRGPVSFVYTHFENTPEARFDAQPLSAADEGFTFVFDGRIDNRADLAEALGINAGDLAVMADSSLAFAAWRRWGIDGLNRWVGEFAAIIWDAGKREISVVRDQFGRRPLHYYIDAKRLIVASMPRAIHQAGGIARKLDRKRLADVLMQIDADLTRSFFEGIKLAAPAHVTVIGPQRWAATRYYSLRDHVKPIAHRRDQTYVEEAEALFSQSVSACLRSPGDVGLQLSAGMDSNLVAAHAAPMLADEGKRLATYTWVLADQCNRAPRPNHCFDETPAARAVAQRYSNIDAHFIGHEGLSLYTGLEDYFHAAEGAMRNALNMALINATGAMAKSHGVKVLLNGSNGNLTLSEGGTGLIYHLFTTGRWLQMAREINAHRTPSHHWKRLLTNILPGPVMETVRRLKGSHNLLEQHLRRQSAALPHWFDERRVMERASAKNYAFHLHHGKNVADRHMTLMENYSGANEASFLAATPALFGFEQRDPYFDRRLIEWRFGVPETQFRSMGKGRWLMRRLLAGKVPDFIAEQSLGIGQQSADWHERLTPDLPRIRQDVREAARLEALEGILNEDKVLGLIERFPPSSENLDLLTTLDSQMTVPLAASVCSIALLESQSAQ